MAHSSPEVLPALDAAACRSLTPLFDLDVPNHPCLSAVLLGHIPGRAVVDDVAAPRHALIRSQYGFTFLSREADQSFLDRAVGQEQRENPVHLIWVDTDGERRVPPPFHLSVARRFEYRARKGPARARPLPDGYSLERMDADLLERCLWKSEVVRACGSVPRFLEVGLGFCILQDTEIACESYAVFRGDGVFEIGVISARAHRGLGLAVHACRRLIEACEDEGLETYWSCAQDNVASNRVAEKLGFTGRRAYRIHLY